MPTTLEDSLFTLLARRSFRKPRKPPGQPGPEFIPPGSNLLGRDSVTMPDLGQNRFLREDLPHSGDPSLAQSFLGAGPGQSPGGFLEGEVPTGNPLFSGTTGAPGGKSPVNPFATPPGPMIPGPGGSGMTLGSEDPPPGPEFDEGDDLDLTSLILRRLLLAGPEERDRAISTLTRLGRGLASPFLGDTPDSGGDLSAAARGTTLLGYIAGDEPDPGI